MWDYHSSHIYKSQRVHWIEKLQKIIRDFATIAHLKSYNIKQILEELFNFKSSMYYKAWKDPVH